MNNSNKIIMAVIVSFFGGMIIGAFGPGVIIVAAALAGIFYVIKQPKQNKRS